MALTIYPNTDWDSYVSLADTETLITANLPVHAEWDLLTDPVKEIYLRQSSTLIKSSITDPEESSTPSDLELATAYLAEYSVGKDMTNSDSSANVKINDVSGVIKKEYFSRGKDSNSFPDIVNTLLTSYGLSSASSFKFDRE